MYFGAFLFLTALVHALPASDHLFSEKSANLNTRSLQVVSNSHTLIRHAGKAPPSSRWLHSQLSNGNQSGQTDIAQVEDAEYVVNVTIGSQEFLMIFDTGSSDTWLVETGFTCVNITDNSTLTEADCDFGSSGYTPDSSFASISDENFNITYGDMEYLNGIFGYDSVTVAGITVSNQTVGLAQLAGWEGDGVTTGLIGFAFPLITDAYVGTNATIDNFTIQGTAPGDHVIYSSITNSIFFVDNLTQPQFSIALSRDESNSSDSSSGGKLAIGGSLDYSLPSVNASGNFTSTPLLPFYNPNFGSESGKNFSFYSIMFDGIVFEDTVVGLGYYNLTAFQGIVDSGTTLNYIDPNSAAIFNALFDPPATYEDGLYYVECNATAPDFSVVIGGTVFHTNPYDLIMGPAPCVSGIQSSLGTGLNIFGDVFLLNVLAVFDLTPGDEKLHFSPRVYYDS